MGEIELLLVANESYCPHLVTVLLSVAATSDRPVRAHVMTNDISLRSRAKVQRAVPSIDVRWLACDSMSQMPNSMNGVDHISYGRLFGPRQLAGQARRVIYLDVDTLVRSDLGELWDADLEGRPIGAVRDQCVMWVGHPALGIPEYDTLGLPPRAPYFNSGVMVIDIDEWMANDVDAACLEYLEGRSQFRFADQDVLNAVFCENWCELPLEWNVFANLSLWAMIDLERPREDLRRARVDPAIAHYAASSKPWSVYMRKDLLFVDEWKSVARSGPFSGWYERRWMVQRLVTALVDGFRSVVSKF